PLSVESFEEFKKDDGGKSKRPMWLFIALLIGLPWLMSKLIKRLQQMFLTPAEGPEAPIHASQIKDLEFCRALYDFKGEGPAELTFSKGDIIAVLSKEDPSTKQPSMWWRGRLRSGPIGYFPANYVEVIEKKVGTSPVQQPQQTMQQQNFKQNQQETFGQQQSFGQMSQQPYQPTLQQQKMGATGDGGGMQNAFGGR
ncbi:SH3 domain-containing protein, partial [Chytridium lagenaria]